MSHAEAAELIEYLDQASPHVESETAVIALRPDEHAAADRRVQPPEGNRGAEASVVDRASFVEKQPTKYVAASYFELDASCEVPARRSDA